MKLAPDRVRELVVAGEGSHYKDQVNAWLELRAGLDRARVRELVDESLRD